MTRDEALAFVGRAVRYTPPELEGYDRLRLSEYGVLMSAAADQVGHGGAEVLYLGETVQRYTRLSDLYATPIRYESDKRRR